MCSDIKLESLSLNDTQSDIDDCLHRVFGHSSFREQQREIITAILSKSDVCAIMATGHGKSICYQIPPLVSKKPAIIVSPLLSLMGDQQLNLSKKGIKVCCYNSTVQDKTMIKEEILAGQYPIIYITPESICTDGMRDFLQCLNIKIGISLVAIDEAHCVSLWGNSFRSSYLQLSCLKDWFPHVPTLALTGTATVQVQQDMIRLLKLRNPTIIRLGSNRPNLSYYVHSKTDPLHDIKPLVENKSSIVYCQTRKITENIAELLSTCGIACEAYHAGLDNTTRDRIHHKFLQGELTCIVATIAFGMGIDKRDIRCVIHYGCPKDIESYVQEVGRAGRDGLKSECHAFFSQADFALNRFFLKDITDPNLRKYKEKMIHAIEKYLYTSDCRRAFLLKYFGETLTVNEQKCCDNCSNLGNAKTINIGNEVKIFIELVSQFNNKFGKTMFINTIRGVNSSKIPQNFRASQYYGIGKSKSEEWWKVAVQHVINADLITIKSLTGHYGTIISVNANGIDWLNLNQSCPTFLVTESPQNTVLFQEINKSKKNAVVKNSPFAKALSSSDSNKAVSQTVLESYNLFCNENKTISEIAKIRNFNPSTVEGHLIDAFKARMPIDFSRLNFSLAKYIEIVEKVNGEPLKGDVSKLAPIKAICSDDTTYLQIKLTIAISELNLMDEIFSTN